MPIQFKLWSKRKIIDAKKLTMGKISEIHLSDAYQYFTSLKSYIEFFYVNGFAFWL